MLREKGEGAAWMRLWLFALVAAYVGLVFPRAYFRHDDWWILGNSIFHLPEDWSFLWRPTLFFNGAEQVWFFRPFFKLGVFGFYRLFGLTYVAWLMAVLGLALAALFLGFRIVQRRASSTDRAVNFVLLWTAALYVHFGSLTWAGEGLMNVPLLFLLLAAIDALDRSVLALSTVSMMFWASVSLSAHSLAFGFKESSGFFFLFAIPWLTASPGSLPRRIGLMVAHTVLGVGFILWRLLFLPMNRAYLPEEGLSAWAFPLACFLAAFGLPLVLLFVTAYVRKVSWKIPDIARAVTPFGFFFAASIGVHLGHPFFSPSWLLVPVTFFLMLLSLPPWPLVKWWEGVSRNVWLGFFALNLFIVGGRVWELGWWQWQTPTRQLQKIVEGASPHTERVHVYNCGPAKYELFRVVGYPEGLRYLWQVYHGRPVVFQSLPCLTLQASEETANTLRLRWEYPRFSVVR